jgi:hypothetical protein
LNPSGSFVDGSAPNDRPEESERLPDEIDDNTVRKYFTLTKQDLEQVDQCRGPANRLGFAVQLCTLRWHGYFLPDTRRVPPSVVEMIGSQLGLLPISLDSYPQNEKTRFEHLERIRKHLGFVRCEAPQRERLLNHLTAIAQGLTRATALRQAAHRWLKQEQIVRPGRTTLRDFYRQRSRSRPRSRVRQRCIEPSGWYISCGCFIPWGYDDPHLCFAGGTVLVDQDEPKIGIAIEVKGLGRHEGKRNPGD